MPCFMLGKIPENVPAEVVGQPAESFLEVDGSSRRNVLAIARIEHDLRPLVEDEGNIVAITPLTSASGALVGASILMELEEPASFSPHRGRPRMSPEGVDTQTDPKSGLLKLDQFDEGSEQYYRDVVSLTVVVSLQQQKVHYALGSREHRFCQ